MGALYRHVAPENAAVYDCLGYKRTSVISIVSIIISVETRSGCANSDFATARQATLTLTRHSCISVRQCKRFTTFMCFLSRGKRDRWQILLWSISVGSLFTCLWYHFAAPIGKSRENERGIERLVRERRGMGTNTDRDVIPQFICAMRFRASTSARVVTNTRFSHLSPPTNLSAS